MILSPPRQSRWHPPTQMTPAHLEDGVVGILEPKHVLGAQKGAHFLLAVRRADQAAIRHRIPIGLGLGLLIGCGWSAQKGQSPSVCTGQDKLPPIALPPSVRQYRCPGPVLRFMVTKTLPALSCRSNMRCNSLRNLSGSTFIATDRSAGEVAPYDASS